jgi:NitT/TauT family transport system substrate-binding protein
MILSLRAPAMSFLPFYVAEEKGFFDRQDVKVRCVHAPEPKSRITQLVIEGEIAFFGSIATAVEAVLMGWGEVRALCTTSASIHPCAARIEIKSLADLKGKKVMAGGGRSLNELLWLCKRYGWRPGVDLEIVSGTVADRVKAFLDPSFAAVFGRAEYLFWIKKGGFHLLPYPDPERGWPGVGIGTSLRMIKENPDTVQRVVAAIVAATEFLKTYRDEAIAVAKTKVSHLGQEEIEANYDLMRSSYTSDISAGAIKHLVEVLVAAKGRERPLKLEDVADLSFLRKAAPQSSRSIQS